jgi:hypothetical protein
VKEPSVEALFDEFALAYRRGERPDVLAYLERVPEGAERDALAGLIDRLLQAVPAREPAEEEVVLMQARLDQEAPLIVLRRRRSLGRQAVVDALVRALRLDPGKREKVAGYYHRLETGLLDPEPVDASVWDALSEVLRANARALAAAFRPPPPTAAPAHRRADEGFALATRRGAVAADQPDLGPDEVDRLFTGSA